MSILSARHHWTLRKDDGIVCACTPPNPRHTSGTQCFTRAEVEAFKRDHGIRSDGHAKSLMYIETFRGPRGGRAVPAPPTRGATTSE